MQKLKYNTLSEELVKRIEYDKEHNIQNPFKCLNESVIRRNSERDKQNLWRPSFVRDIEKILHLPLYNRYADKTQVFSFYHNDDITRRALHVQLVSRIARNIGAVLGLNLDLIEAISLGHDLGHTPFGHAGERFLSELLFENTGRYFNHNVHSVRVLDNIFARNMSLQTLDGILCHNGEFEMQEYRPQYNKSLYDFDIQTEACYNDQSEIKKLVPCTLEGCVVRICDIIAYLGKDRQDAKIARILSPEHRFETEKIGTENAAIINNMTVDIIENSYGKDHIMMSGEVFSDLKRAKKENYEVIYHNDSINTQYESIIRPMFSEMYYTLLNDINNENQDSVIFRHHIDDVEKSRAYYSANRRYLDEEHNQIVVDYIASMTDDYFIALHKMLFPDSKNRIEYHSYFEA